MKSIYYAHCMALYGTPTEARDIKLLEALGFIVINPNSDSVQAAVANCKSAQYDHGLWEIFRHLIEGCDVLAFRALPDGAITSGVAKEINMARRRNIPVIEIPSAMLRRTLTLDETRQYLKEVGQR